MRCARCARQVGTVYEIDGEEVCRWDLSPDELNRVQTAEARDEAEQNHG